jgi:putative nucleotidyltransferase with HDIG domain
MDRPYTILKSKLGKRIILLFLVCALVPISALGGISFMQVKSQLNAQTERWLHEETKSKGMAILDRLSLLKAEIFSFRRIILDHLERKPNLDPISLAHLPVNHLGGVALDRNSEFLSIQGKAEPPMLVTQAQREHLAAGKVALITQREVGGRSLAYLVVALDPSEPSAGLIWGETNIPFLLSQNETDTLPAGTELMLLDQEGQVLYATTDPDPDFLGKARASLRESSAGKILWSGPAGAFLSYHWSAFLKPEFLAHQWTVFLSLPADDVLAAMSDFSRSLPKVLAVSFLTVLLLSVIQLRRNLQPLHLLKEGTQKIANRRFDTRVALSSGDEFEDLADAFNDMARRLDGQFQALTAMAEIDRTALSFPKQERMVDTVLSQVKDRFLIDVVALTLCKKNGREPKTFMAGRGALPNRPVEVTRPIPRELLYNNTSRETMLLSREDSHLPAYLSDYTAHGVERFLLLPIRLNGQTTGLLSLGSTNGHLWDEETVALSRQIADQVGIALSNVSLLEELEHLNWGTLKALARTVDAKSPWTAGHSERVADLAVKIGEEMGLDAGDLANLHRAALLHDIGKIGVPSSILDKPGRLTEEEYERIKKHPTLGAQILEPISAYAEVVDLVRQHHERLDGSGYPGGLTGIETTQGARILGVADTFDAMTSERPYRKGMEVDKSLEIIKSERSIGLDPDVVDAFLGLMAKEQTIRIDSAIPEFGPVAASEMDHVGTVG